MMMIKTNTKKLMIFHHSQKLRLLERVIILKELKDQTFIIQFITTKKRNELSLTKTKGWEELITNKQ
jgi:hypothetical protein